MFDVELFQTMGVLYRDKYEINTMMIRILKVKRKNGVECMIAKSEIGRTGSVDLGWCGEFAKIENILFVHQTLNKGY